MTITQNLDAGPFSSWLREVRGSLAREDGIDVPCGGCTACCRSSLFIHIGPEESDTLARIPKELQFPAPGLPKGYVVLGYDADGQCPMFAEDRCSIYEYRPSTCRNFDCRVFSASGLGGADDEKSLIAQQAQRWEFTFSEQPDLDQYAAVRTAATFLRDHVDLFPPGFVPRNTTQLAVLAIKVYDVFYELNKQGSKTEGSLTDIDIAKLVMKAFEEFQNLRSQSGDTEIRSAMDLPK